MVIVAFSLSLSDPPATDPLLNSISWIENALLGTVASVIAIIAVAAVGAMTLTGRVNVRYGATVIVGCFVLFGARQIAAGLQSVATETSPPMSPTVQVTSPPAFAAPPRANPQPVYDPYAGASVPQR